MKISPSVGEFSGSKETLCLILAPIMLISAILEPSVRISSKSSETGVFLLIKETLQLKYYIKIIYEEEGPRGSQRPTKLSFEKS